MEKFYPKRNKWVLTMIKIVSCMFKKHKLFFISVGIGTETYRFKIDHFLPIFDFWNRDQMTGHRQTWWAYSLLLQPRCVQISTFHVQQIYSYKRINKFSRQKW